MASMHIARIAMGVGGSYVIAESCHEIDIIEAKRNRGRRIMTSDRATRGFAGLCAVIAIALTALPAQRVRAEGIVGFAPTASTFPSSPNLVAVNPVTNKMYAVMSGQVVVFDAATLTQTPPILLTGCT